MTGLREALRPRSVAVIGASDDPNKVGGRPLRYLLRFGFRGTVYAVNASRETVQGLRAYRRLADLPEPPDAAAIALPGNAAVAAVEECAARGVRLAVVMSSGFAETAGEGDAANEARIAAAARVSGMRVIGPNSQGIADFSTGLVLSFSTMFIEEPPEDGPVGIVSQSGIMSVVPYGLLRRRGIGVRCSYATGNECDVTLEELAEAVLADPEIRLLLLYAESLRKPDVLARAAECARDRGVPIVAVKAGRTPRGQDAARSHTAAMATEDRIAGAFLRRHGILRARDEHELVAGAELYLGNWRPRGRRLVIVSNSGASCVMGADAAEERGLTLVRPEPETIAGLRAVLPRFAAAGNPVDVTAGLLTDSGLIGKVLEAFRRSSAADLYLVALPVSGEGYEVETLARDVAAFSAATSRAVVAATPQEAVALRFRERGVPTFASHTGAIDALARLVEHVELMDRRPPPGGRHAPAVLPVVPTRFLTESESLAVVASCGLPVVPHRLCRSAAEAREALRALGGEVAMKGCTPAVPHKSRCGLVALRVRSETEVAAEFDRLWRALGGPVSPREGVLVASMMEARRELVLGAKIDPAFGPVVMIGDGGPAAEALDDVAFLIPPFPPEEARDALRSLRIGRLLSAGGGGEPWLDVDAVASLTVRFGAFVLAHAAEIASIDLNPVMVGAPGDPIAIADALIEPRAAHPAASAQE